MSTTHDGGQHPPLLSLPAGLSVTVRVPATSANLGPGYDSLGLAVSVDDAVTISTTDSGLLEFDLSGEGADEVPRDERHLVIKTFIKALAELGYQHQGLKLQAHNVIPHGRGLGSSAAAVVAAAAAANALVPVESRRDAAWLLQFTSAIEGHPDNVAPAIFGDLALSWQEGADFHSARVEVAEGITPVVAIPDYELSTEVARSLIPATINHHDAAMNSGRSALLVAALTGQPHLLFAGTRDYLHQGFRASAMKPSAALIEALRAEGHAAVVSGAGPTVLVLSPSPEAAAQAAELISAQNGTGVSWRVLTPGISADGVRVEEHRR